MFYVILILIFYKNKTMLGALRGCTYVISFAGILLWTKVLDK